jgi:hypothetical protein
MRDVVYDVSPAGDAGADPADPTCFAMFDQCSDGLTHELDCRDGRCDCIIDGEKQGRFQVERASVVSARSRVTVYK